MELVGRYRIERRIGEGAMADVYRAQDPTIGRPVAIKILKPEYRQNHEIAARFLREAKAAGALSHSNIVTIYDVGEVDGYPYIAMELLDGEPLDEAIRRAGRLPLKVALRIGHQLAKALDYAHGLGVVHRDIKPSNIMICDGGRTAKILDFGIARIGEADRLRAEINALRTQAGQVLGTPRYMSPEQALGLDIDHRSDLFSLGVVLYEMLTGQMAFSGSSLATIALQITQQQPQDIGELLPDCPRGVEFIVRKLLAKQPERRYASGGEVAAALRREQDVLRTDGLARRSRIPLPLKLTFFMAAVTSLALLLGINMVLNRQRLAMEGMALTSGSSIASFVAKNVALRAVENAGLAPAQQDWMPVQAFVTTAASDENVQQITIVDAFGVIRGSSDPRRIGQRYAPHQGEKLLRTNALQAITSTGPTAQDGYRIVHTIRYAGRPFGTVDLVVGKAELKAALLASRNLLLALGAFMFLVVLCVSFALAQLLQRPLGRLQKALSEAATGKLDFRISHRRTDEFGQLFDSFNRLAASFETREWGGDTIAPGTSLDATRVDARPSVPFGSRMSQNLRRSG